MVDWLVPFPKSAVTRFTFGGLEESEERQSAVEAERVGKLVKPNEL